MARILAIEHLTGAPNNQKVNSTKRDPFSFKLVNPKARHCTICQQPGYNAHT
ncbi:8999_t:CDS:2, partial [Cetraspora pellucida]